MIVCQTVMKLVFSERNHNFWSDTPQIE